MRFALAIVMVSGCYSGNDAATDVNVAWRGHGRVELEARLGQPGVVQPQQDGTTALRWMRKGHNVTLPSGSLDVNITSTSFDISAEARPGVVETYDYELASALIAPGGAVLDFRSRWLAAGIPSGMNLRTGVIFGLSGALGGRTDATGPMPSVGMYLGGMIGPRLALLGAYQFVNGKADAGYAMGHAWGLALQQWVTARFNVRAGGAMVLDIDPGLENPKVRPGAIGALSFALVRSGSFVLDARFDATIATSTVFGMFGIGVNVN